ncbi:CRISPR-associated helicase Cas3' [Hydrogenophilus islandicus]
MRFSDLPPAARALWAKSGEPCGHGLLAHMLDVAAVAEVILKRESPQTKAWVAKVFSLSQESVPRWMGALCGLHDFGKAIPGFQAKWLQGQQADETAGLRFPHVALNATRHDLASAALLRSDLARHFPGSPWISAVSLALGAHHGYFPRLTEVREAKPIGEGREWSEARAQLLEAYLTTLLPDESPACTEVSLPAAAWLAGLTSVADWIGSNQEWFPPGERGETLAEHHAASLELAEEALDAIGWPGFRPLLAKEAGSDELIGRILGRPDPIAARPLQQAADRLLRDADGPVLMIVEAPMGEGKTELAFLAHLRLQAAYGHRGLYVALPTQATGNAMFDRALTFLRSFSPEIRLDIQLVHGGAVLDERVHRLRGVNADESDSIASSAWFAQGKRALLSPYGVGTVDQIMLATLHVKHHFVRLWGLANRVVVLDEIHAYDTYTGGLIEALLHWLKGMHCSVVLMSATLPAHRRREFLKAWGAKDAPEIAYPRVQIVDAQGVRGETVACRALPPIEVNAIPESLEAIAEEAIAALADGGCGVVIVNTVQRAQDLYSLLKDKMPKTYGSEAQLLLFHARYPADERSDREKRVLATFGRGHHVQRPTRALLIATQVVEQSLDIDFDWMITDLAPVDLLLQRAGRLHRHERQRPTAHTVPRLRVAGLQRDRLPELEKTAWGFVYDPYLLYRTWAIVRNESRWHLPHDIDRLVQAVYGSDDLLQWADDLDDKPIATIDAAYGKSRAAIQDQKQRAINATINAEAEVQNAYDKPRANEEGEGFEGLRAVTRLGDEGVTVVPVIEEADGWRLFAGDAPIDPNLAIDDTLARRIYRRQVRLSRKELIQAILAQPLPKGFESHPLLRNLRPLRFGKDGVADLGRLRVRLDPELGIIYETATKEER